MGADPLLPWLFAVKLGLYVACLAAGGFSLHAASGVVERQGRRQAMRIAAGSAALVLVFSGLRILIVNAQLGGGWSSAFDAGSLHWSWRVLGPSTMTATAGALVVATGWAAGNWGAGAPLLAAAGSIALAASFALTGHSEALATPGLAPWAVGLHVLIAAFWVTAPFVLWPGTSVSDAHLTHRLQRFSAIATWAVPVLFALGLWLLWRLAGGIAAVIGSTYGRLLVAKFLVALIALGMGALNKLRLTQNIEAGRAGARRALRRTLIIEGVVFAAALALVAFATTVTGPPETSQAVRPGHGGIAI